MRSYKLLETHSPRTNVYTTDGERLNNLTILIYIFNFVNIAFYLEVKT